MKFLNQAVPNAAVKVKTCPERIKNDSNDIAVDPTTAEKVEQEGVQVAA